MSKYRKKPVVIEAKEFMGSADVALSTWCGGTLVALGAGFWNLEIPTLEGQMTASPGDFIIKGVNGEFYPCKPTIFEKTYEKVDE